MTPFTLNASMSTVKIYFLEIAKAARRLR